MKRVCLILAIVVTSGLLIGSQALASGQYQKAGGAEGAAQMATQAAEQNTQLNLNQEQIKEMQRLLQDKGYQIGENDGVINQETTAAIRQYQEAEGLAVTGEPNQETLQALAPNSDQQEFFGLSPEFGEMGKKAE